MEQSQIDVLARQAGIVESALPDVAARIRGHWPDTEPSAQAVAQWLTETLKPAAPHLYTTGPQQPWEKLGLAEAVWHSLPPATRRTLWREAGLAAPPVKRRPEPLTLTPEQAEAFAAITNPAARLAAYRELQAATVPRG